MEKEKLEKEEFERKIQEQKLLKEKLIKEQEENERKEREFKEKLKIEKARIEKEEKLRLENEEKHKQKFLMELKMKKELLKQQLIDKDSKKYLNYISRSIDGTNNYNKNLRLDNSPSLEKNSFIYKSKFQTKKLKLPNLKNSFELPLINRINLGVYNNKINLINNFDSVVHNNNNLRYKLSSNNSNNQIYKISVQKPPIRFQPFNYDKRLINNNYGYRNNLNLYNNYNGYKLNKDVYINQNLKKKLIPIKKIY